VVQATTLKKKQQMSSVLKQHFSLRRIQKLVHPTVHGVNEATNELERICKEAVVF
jgi:hypothetical protein